MTANPPSWHRIRDVFDEVVALPPEARAASLDRLCGHDTALRAEVESLLSHDDAGGEPLAAIVQRAASDIANDDQQLRSGATVLHYRIVERVGEGAMGVVWRAVDSSLGRTVAIKVLPSAVAHDAARLVRFEREARLLATLNHSNVATIYSVHAAEGLRFLAMEFVDGEDLAVVLARGRLPAADAIRLAGQIAEGLEEAHERGIIHRDLKPANIKVTPSGKAKVLDFGLAKAFESGADSSASDTFEAEPSSDDGSPLITRAGLILGTAAYMAPEQARGKAVDKRADIWAFGVVLFEMVSGHRPFRGTTVTDVLEAVVHADPAWELLPVDTPPPLEHLIRRCLVKDARRRLRDIGDARLELDALGRAREGHAPTLSEPPSSSVSSAVTSGLPPAPTTRGRWLWPAAAGLVAAVALGGYVVGGRGLARDDAPIDSIAVLPFVNGDADPETDYLADGISESIRNSLSELRSLRVMAEASVRQYRGQQVDVRAVGKALGVRAVFTGTISTRGDTIRIQSALVDTESGAQLWGQQVTRDQRDILAIEDDLASGISGGLKLRLSGEEQQRVSRRETADADAYRSFLKGRAQWNLRTNESYRKAIEFFRVAIDTDPSYARAYVGLADASAFFETPGEPSRERYERALGIVKRALELDDTLGDAHTTLALLRQNKDWDLPGAEQAYRRALELSPSYATAHHWYGEMLIQMGRLDEGAEHYRLALEVDPLSPAIRSDRAFYWYYARDFDRAILELQKAVAVDPAFGRSHRYLSTVLAQVGRFDAAASEHERSLVLTGVSVDDAAAQAAALKRAAATSGAQGYWSTLLEIEMKKPLHEGDWPHNAALLYARLGDEAHAMPLLEQALDGRVFEMLFLNVSPDWDRLRDRPSFKALVDRVGFPTT